MTEEEINKVLRLEKIHNNIKPEFSFSLCKQVLKISNCENCPVYCTIFSPD